ncbi:MAG: nucleotidyl transferase AbiEii/AbiGii toxin family protein [Bacteroidetes bacterium]|nr:nucleotidyl transferase AbiEii/AbiGii toxin family protein [Bacteroidota bacterium]
MKDSFKINIEQLRQEGLKELFEALERAFNALKIDFYLVGAIARDTWFVHNGMRPSGTKDVDFAVFIPAKEDFEKLKKHLKEKEGFNDSTQNEFVLFSPKGLQVDLLPFGEIEVEGKVMLEGKGFAKIAVNGFREVYENGTHPVEFDKHTFKVCSLPGIVILKLIAYDDRPQERQKDIEDVRLILDHYFDIESDIIYENHNDLFENNAELPHIAARVLGRQMKLILDRSTDLKQRVISILEVSAQRSTSCLSFSQVVFLCINQYAHERKTTYIPPSKT